MKLQFCGAARTVTGSCHFLDIGKYKILVDCGAFQGSDELEALNREPFPFNASEIDFVLLTHAHFDHVGRMPLLVKRGFNGRIICTQPTRDLARVVLEDAARIQDSEYNRWIMDSQKKDLNPNRENAPTPLYTNDDVQQTLDLMDVYPLDNTVSLVDGVEFRMRDSGHILGSVIFEVWAKNSSDRVRKIVFSGDLGHPGQRIVKDPEIVKDADYVLIESTYGNRLHRSKDETILEFLTILKQAHDEGGNVLIPTFAIERSQEIIYELNLLYENNLLSGGKVYLDSPMAFAATEIFKRYPTFYDDDARRLIESGDDPFAFEEFTMISEVEESKRLADAQKSIIMAGSGMCNGGRIQHHLINHAAEKNAHIIFVGFQVEGTLGRHILDGAPKARIHGKDADIYAKVHTMGGFSAHGDKRDLLYWLRGFGRSPKEVFVVHGEEGISEDFAKEIHDDLRLNVTVPSMNEVVNLD